jgi:hypothetical protein
MENKSNTPTHKIFSIRNRGEGKKASWTEIGIGFTNKDGSLNLTFNCIPVDGKCQIRKVEQWKNENSKN